MEHAQGTNRSLQELPKAGRLSLRSCESLEESVYHAYNFRHLAANVAHYDFRSHKNMRRMQRADMGHQVIKSGGRNAAGTGQSDRAQARPGGRRRVR